MLSAIEVYSYRAGGGGCDGRSGGGCGGRSGGGGGGWWW